MHLDIVAVGEPMIEFNQTGGAGSTSYLQGFGGDTSNFAIAAARQGARAGVVTALGDDVHGGMLRELWATEGVDASRVKSDPTAPTGIYFVTHDESGHHFTFFRSGSAASRMTPADVPADYIASARALHVSGISFAISPQACDAAYAAVEVAREAGRMVTFDTNLRLRLWSKDRARAIILDMMSRCDVCLPSLDDVTLLTGIEDADELVDFALGRGAKIVALKLGREGALVADANERHRIAPLRVDTVDATGAGDTFGGAFVARLLQGDGLEAAGRYAAAAAALSTTGYGAVDPIPTAEAVLEAMGD
jgi:2-dehydro-3-deoxygluconokinase